MGGDYRGLTFCCRPGYALTFGFKCQRDATLKEIGMTPEEFESLKDEFSREHDWDSPLPCFGSLAYCCMRRGGCPRRDPALLQRYPNLPWEEVLAEYFRTKKTLARRILEAAGNQERVAECLALLRDE